MKKKNDKIETITQPFIAICHFPLRSRNSRLIAFEPQDSKDHFRYLTFWATTPVFFFFPTSEKRSSLGLKIIRNGILTWPKITKMGPKSHFFDNYGTKKKNRFEEEVPSSSQYLKNG